MTHLLSRRHALAVLAGTLLPRLGWPRRDLPAGDSWQSLVGNPQSGRTVGRAYLTSRSGRVDPRALERLLLPADPQRAAWVLGDVERLRRHVRERIRSDFEAGRTVRVRGWVLAETEARVCALLSLRRA